MDDRQLEKREARRKRRLRNQVISYTVVVLFITAVAAGAVWGVRQLTADRREAKDSQDESQAALDDLLGAEPEITEPPVGSEPASGPETEPEVILTPEQELDELVNAMIDVMPIEDKVAGLFIVTPESITGVGTALKAGEGTKNALTQ